MKPIVLLAILLPVLTGCERTEQPHGDGGQLVEREAKPQHQHSWIDINNGVLSTDSNGAPVLIRWRNCWECGQPDVRAVYPTYETNRAD